MTDITKMQSLPASVICIWPIYVLDEPDVIEALLQENPDLEKCLPYALQQFLDIPEVLDPITTSKYLYALWNILDPTRDLSKSTRYWMVAGDGLVYLLPYINTEPDLDTVMSSLGVAIDRNRLSTVKYLLDKMLNMPLRSEMERLSLFLIRAAQHGENDVFNYFFNKVSEIYGKMPLLYSTLPNAVKLGDTNTVQTLLDVILKTDRDRKRTRITLNEIKTDLMSQGYNTGKSRGAFGKIALLLYTM